MNTILAHIAKFAAAPASLLGSVYTGTGSGAPQAGGAPAPRGLDGVCSARRDDDNILNMPPAN